MDDLGPLFTPADLVRGGLLYRASPCLRAFLAQACQSLWLVVLYDASERSVNLTVSSDSSACPDETTGWATLSGRLQTQERSAFLRLLP